MTELYDIRDARAEIDRLQRALELKDAALRQTEADLQAARDAGRAARKLCLDLLDPEMFGHAVTAEIRNAARRAIGNPATEPTQVIATESFNDSNAWRDAISASATTQCRSCK